MQQSCVLFNTFPASYLCVHLTASTLCTCLCVASCTGARFALLSA